MYIISNKNPKNINAKPNNKQIVLTGFPIVVEKLKPPTNHPTIIDIAEIKPFLFIIYFHKLHSKKCYFLIEFKIGIAQLLTVLYCFSRIPSDERNKSFASLYSSELS